MYNLLSGSDTTVDALNLKPTKEKNSDSHINKSLFKDKKLNKLWEKAEMAGFTTIELEALKEEFNHHQDKIDQYYAILSDVKDGERKDDQESKF